MDAIVTDIIWSTASWARRFLLTYYIWCYCYCWLHEAAEFPVAMVPVICAFGMLACMIREWRFLGVPYTSSFPTFHRSTTRASPCDGRRHQGSFTTADVCLRRSHHHYAGDTFFILIAPCSIVSYISFWWVR